MAVALRELNVLTKLVNTVMWSYRPGTPDETLLRHAWRAECVVTFAFGASVLMACAMLEALLSEPGGWRTFWVSISIGATLIAVPMLIPGIIALCVAREALRSLKDKSTGQRLLDRLDYKPAMLAAKLAAYFSLLVLSTTFVGNDPTRRAAAAAILFGLFALGLVRKLLRQRISALPPPTG